MRKQKTIQFVGGPKDGECIRVGASGIRPVKAFTKKSYGVTHTYEATEKHKTKDGSPFYIYKYVRVIWREDERVIQKEIGLL